jgi:uncharacterized protein
MKVESLDPIGEYTPETVSSLPSYHLFEKCGEKFVYSLSLNKFFRVDAATYDLLRLALTEPLETAQNLLLERGLYTEQQLEDIVPEVEWLQAYGLGAVPSFSIPQEKVERELTQRYAVPWTKLELALAESCNLACKYCYCSTCPDMPNQGLMSKNYAKRAIEWLFAVTGPRKEIGITLFGGEPLLNREVFKFVMDYSQKLAHEHKKKVNYTMTTNGTLLDDMSIAYIKRHNFGLMVSLDGPKEIHDAQCPTRDGQGSFDAAARGIKALMSRRRTVTVRCTMTDARPRMLDLINFFEDFGFTRIVLGRTVNPVNPSPVDCSVETFHDFERQEEEDLIPWMFEKLARGERPKYFPFGEFIYKQANEVMPPELSVCRCGACRGTMTVGADGKLYPCHRYVGMSQFVIGHIDEGPDVEKAKEFWRDYNRTVQEKCDNCWARQLCTRPCPWEISNADGSFRPPDEAHCDLIKRYFERAAHVHYKFQKELPEEYAKYVTPRSLTSESPASPPDNN